MNAGKQKGIERRSAAECHPIASGLKKILVATDLSSRAHKALLRAAQLATEHEATLEILYVREDRPRDETTVNRDTDAVDLELRRTMAACAFPPERFTIVHAIGRPVVEIIRHAREGAADLIVAGDHESKVLSDAFGRITGQDIVREGDRPLLVVKRAPRKPYRRVLVAVDFSEYSRWALQFALRLAPQAEFRVLHAYEGVERQLWRTDITPSEIMRYRRQFAKKARQEMKAFLGGIERDRKRLTSAIWFGRPPHAITLAANRWRAELVAVGSAGRTGLPRILLGSVAEHVMRHIRCDVLVVRSEPTAMEAGSRSSPTR